MDNKTRKSNPPKRLPSSLIERNLKTTNLLIRIGLQTSGNMISDLFMGKSVNLKKSLFLQKMPTQQLKPSNNLGVLL